MLSLPVFEIFDKYFPCIQGDFLNQLYELFQATNSSVPWEEFIKMISFEKIGKSHMQVPGHDGKFGYGGACFPKDVNAFIKYSRCRKRA